MGCHGCPSVFFVSQCRKTLWGTVKCFRNFGESENFLHNRRCCDFPSTVFSLILPSNLVGDPSLSDKISGLEKIVLGGISRFSLEGGVARFSLDFFISQSTEIFVGEPSRFH